MIRILRIINRFNLGGPTYNAAYLTRYMGDEYETMLVGGMQDETEASSEFIVTSLGIHPIRIPQMQRSINPVSDYNAYQKIKQLISEFKPHIVHTHASKAGALGRRAASHLKVPVIVHTFHGHVFDAYFGRLQSNVYVRLERHLAGKSDAIITLSDNQRFDIVEKFKICESEKVHIIPLGFDLSKFQQDQDIKREVFRKKHAIKPDEIAIGIIGRLVPVKNHALFVDGIRELYFNSGVKIRAFFVGDGESKQEIQQLLKAYNIPFSENGNTPKTAVFTSWEKDVDVVNAGLDIIALTSLNEGTPVSLIEAQAANKPIVTTNVGGIRNIVSEGQTALIADIHEPGEFVAKLKLLAENEELRHSLSTKGWDFVSQKFHYSRLVRDMDNLYQTLLQKKLYSQ